MGITRYSTKVALLWSYIKTSIWLEILKLDSNVVHISTIQDWVKAFTNKSILKIITF